MIKTVKIKCRVNSGDYAIINESDLAEGDELFDEKPEAGEKDALEKHAKEKFGVDLDRRKSLKKLKAQVAELEAR